MLTEAVSTDKMVQKRLSVWNQNLEHNTAECQHLWGWQRKWSDTEMHHLTTTSEWYQGLKYFQSNSLNVTRKERQEKQGNNVPTGPDSQEGLDDLVKNNCSGDGEINLQQTEKQPDDQEVDGINGDFCCHSRNVAIRRRWAITRAGAKREMVRQSFPLSQTGKTFHVYMLTQWKGQLQSKKTYWHCKNPTVRWLFH